jgi:streptomycin 6-kinase
VEHVLDTESALIGFGRRKNQAVVLKVLKRRGDEWRSGEVVRAFHGQGVVRVYEYVDGALLLERLTPGHSLVHLTLDGRDDEATTIIADVIEQMSEPDALTGCPTVHDWGKAFDRHEASGPRTIPPALVEEGHRWFAVLASSQRNARLLHGDLHHYNVLLDSRRGWLAIDPKGVIGETEYEIGAVLRNPYERPDLFIPTSAIERRLTRLAKRLNLDLQRALAWSFAQAVLSAIWSIEDGFPVDTAHSSIRLANTLRVMLPAIP